LFDGKDLSVKGNKLKNEIEKLYISNKKLFNNYSELENYNELHFNTSNIIDKNGNEIKYFQDKLFNKPVIDVLEYLEKLKLELNTFQYIFFNTVIQS
ncbi:hypothetical protein, partial [Tenacibaculum geojense]